MEQLIVLVVLAVLGVPLALAIWLIVRAVQAKGRIEDLSYRVGELEAEVLRLKRDQPAAKPAEPVPVATPATTPVAAPIKTAEVPTAPPLSKSAAPPQPVVTSPPPPVVAPAPISTISPPPKLAPAMVPPARPAFNLEQFLGVKGFMWIGGLGAFLVVVLGIRYAFEHNWISPALRMALGFIAGLGLLAGGVVLHGRKAYTVGAQTLCATGVVILYAVTFACRSIYHFEFFGQFPTFLLMALITATAFLLAARLNAMVVAILGMLGGFLTPYLLSTGQDNPSGLFGYIAILDAGLIVVALNRRWHFLTALAAAGTAVMQIGWAGEFFEANKYFEGNKILVALIILLGFNLLYLGAAGAAKWRGQANKWLSGSTLGLVVVALVFTIWFLSFPTLAGRPWLIFSFVFLIDFVVAALVLLDNEIAPAQPLAGLAVFGLLAVWTAHSLTNALLNAGLVFYLVFAIVHSVFPVLLHRRYGIRAPLWAGQLFPPLALVLVLIPIFKLAELSFIVWPIVLLVDVLAIGLAVLLGSLLPVLVVMLLTLAATGALIFKIPIELTGLPTSFFLLGAFAIFFVAVSVWAVRKLKPDLLKKTIPLNEDVLQSENLAAFLPACSAVLPFLLLIMATLRLPMSNPSPVFGLALLLVVLLLGITKLFAQDWLPAIGLACVAALECAWHFSRFDPANPNVSPALALTWYLVFFAVFTLFPFLFLKPFANRVPPWAAAALAGLPQFLLIHRLVPVAYPNHVMGLLPAAFAIPPLLSLVVILKKIPAASPARMTQLAWFGGVALFFITLIFPIQFDRQWITIGWALEGAALLWLFHRVPHPGLRLTGVGLLMAAFVRLALNPAVFEYHVRSATPIINWYLYTYGIVTVCLFAGARLLAPPRNLVLRSNVPPLLAGLGTVLAFLLLNIEIADYFSTTGSTLTFQFRGNFARDMTYSIAWALFALGLLVIGIVRKIPVARYSAIGLLCVTLVKLYFHDLTRLEQLYRIGAIFGVSVTAWLAAFAYQRFFAASAKDKETKDETAK
jgi:hypothetical protein